MAKSTKSRKSGRTAGRNPLPLHGKGSKGRGSPSSGKAQGGGGQASQDELVPRPGSKRLGLLQDLTKEKGLTLDQVMKKFEWERRDALEAIGLLRRHHGFDVALSEDGHYRVVGRQAQVARKAASQGPTTTSKPGKAKRATSKGGRNASRCVHSEGRSGRRPLDCAVTDSP
jgi:hypothetical protein